MDLKQFKKNLTFIHVLTAFIIFIIVPLFFIPLGVFAYLFIKTGSLQETPQLSLEFQGWLSDVSIMCTFLLLAGFTSILDREARSLIWQRDEPGGSHLKSFFIGVAAWLISYPTVLIIGQLIHWVLYEYLGYKEVEQVAVKALKLSETSPFLHICTIFCMILLVPVAEELLFRGFLQTWLRGKTRPRTAILFTSIIFASFHFSFSQGASNIEILSALFILSCFLGFLYEREKSLWAPIGLHMAINGVSIAMTSLSGSI